MIYNFNESFRIIKQTCKYDPVGNIYIFNDIHFLIFENINHIRIISNNNQISFRGSFHISWETLNLFFYFLELFYENKEKLEKFHFIFGTNNLYEIEIMYFDDYVTAQDSPTKISGELMTKTEVFNFITNV